MKLWKYKHNFVYQKKDDFLFPSMKMYTYEICNENIYLLFRGKKKKKSSITKKIKKDFIIT